MSSKEGEVLVEINASPPGKGRGVALKRVASEATLLTLLGRRWHPLLPEEGSNAAASTYCEPQTSVRFTLESEAGQVNNHQDLNSLSLVRSFLFFFSWYFRAALTPGSSFREIPHGLEHHILSRACPLVFKILSNNNNKKDQKKKNPNQTHFFPRLYQTYHFIFFDTVIFSRILWMEKIISSTYILYNFVIFKLLVVCIFEC